MHWQSFLCGLGIVCAGMACRDDGPVQDLPLSDAERASFDDPLELAAWREPGSWPQFAHDPLHTGRANVDFPSSDLQLAWQFRPTDRVRSYEPGFSVWSCPVVGTVGGRPLVIAGYYDRNVYAVDGVTGEKVWEFQPGAPVFASPALARVDDRPIVVVASINRSVYGLDAATGKQQWVFETQPWTFTQAPSRMSSPTIVRDGDEAVAVIGVWNADRSASRNVQSGEVIALWVADGHLKWRKRLCSVPVTSPAVARLGDELVVFVATEHGMVHALRLADGVTRWEAVLNEELRSSVSLAAVGGVGRLLVGTRFHTLFALDWRTGRRRWRTQAGFWLDATPAWFEAENRTTVVAGSHDQNVYAFAASDGHTLWNTRTGNYAYSSAAVATVAGRPVALAMSWDQHVYMLDGGTGDVRFKAKSGPLLWSYAFQGDSLWASPVVARVAEKPTLLVAACDGILYGHQPRPAPTATSAPDSD